MRKNVDLSIFKNSKFRISQKLNKTDFNKLCSFSDEKLHQDAFNLITKRLAPAFIINDGKQTPFKGHPIFVAQHATATCCRECLQKWHFINKDRVLTESEINYIVKYILLWLNDFKLKNHLKNTTDEKQLVLF